MTVPKYITKEDRLKHTKLRPRLDPLTIPVATYICCYCTDQQIVYGEEPQRLANLAGATEIRRVHFRTQKSLYKTLKQDFVRKDVLERPEAPCHVCTRDIHHFSMTGKYPYNSILWELRLRDRSLK